MAQAVKQDKSKVIDPNEWEDINPNEWEDVPEQGTLSKIWDFANKPLITAPSDIARSVGQGMTEHTLDESPFWAKMRGFGAGALQGIGDMVSGLTSPLGLATAATGGGELLAAKRGLPEIASMLSKGTKVLSAPYAIHGGSQIVDPNSTLGERAMGFAELASGVAGMAHKAPGRVGKIGESIRSDIPIERVELGPHESFDPVADVRTHMGEGQPSLDIVDDAPLHVNGSGESSASLEAINRQKSMQNKGEQFVVYDKTGQRKVLIGPDAVDYTPANGETYGLEGPKGFQVLEDKGGKYKHAPGEAKPPVITQSPTEPTAIFIKSPDPAVIKQVMQKGYVFDSMRDDGAFKMVKSDKKLNLPILESEVGNARPTPANAARTPANVARMADGELPPTGGGGDVIEGAPKRNVSAEIFNFPRVVMASMDFSAPLRQGLTLIHKKQFWTSLDDMFKAWGSKKAYDAIQTDILERPLFKARVAPNGNPIRSFAEEAGLKLTDLKSLSSREEHIMSTWADKVPGVARSNRAYTAFLNKLRADTFEDLIKRSAVFGADGKTNLPLARELANFVNTASGRGSLGKLESSAVALNSMLFSPRLIASRLTMLNPKYYITANPFVRKEALKSLLAVASVGSTLGQLARMTGASVEADPRSSDFGKIKIGNTRLDPYGGFQQYIVAATKLLSGSSVSSVNQKEHDLWNPNNPYDPTLMDTITRFGRGKLHPVLGFAISLLNGAKEMSGQPMNFSTPNPMDNAIGQRFIPIVMQDLYSIAKEDPSLLPFLTPLIMGGMGSQVYGDQSEWK